MPPERRPERPGDAAFRFDLFRESRGAIFAGFEEPLRSLILQQQFAAQDAGYRATHPDGCFDVVVDGGVPIGRIVTAREAGALLLVDLAIAPAFRRRGHATRLLRALLDEARTGGHAVRLRVATDNAAARRLYERLGFVAVAADEIELTMEAVPAIDGAVSDAAGRREA